MEMRGGGGAGKTGIGQLPAQLLGRGVIVDVGRAGPGAGIGGQLGLAVQGAFVLLGAGRSCEGNGCPQYQRSIGGLGHGSLSLLTSNVTPVFQQNRSANIPEIRPPSAIFSTNLWPGPHPCYS